jgi:hypothetical protein
MATEEISNFHPVITSPHTVSHPLKWKLVHLCTLLQTPSLLYRSKAHNTGQNLDVGVLVCLIYVTGIPVLKSLGSLYCKPYAEVYI